MSVDETLLSFEDDSKAPVSDEDIASISILVKRMRKQTAHVNELKALLKNAEDALQKTAQMDIPLAMAKAQTTALTTDDGTVVTIRDDVFASISKANKDDAFKWLDKHGFGDLIKHKVQTTFGRGESEKAKEMIELLNEAGYVCDQDVSIHPGTLKAFIREQMSAGKDVPLELFGVFQFKEAKIHDK